MLLHISYICFRWLFWGDPHRVLETISVYDFMQIIEKALIASVDSGIYNVGSGGTTLEERVRGI